MNEIHTIWKYIMGYPWLTLYLYDSVYMKRLCTHLKSWSYAMVSLCTPNQWDWLKHLWIRCSSNCNIELFINITIDMFIITDNSKNCNEIHNYTIFNVIKSKSMKRIYRFVTFIIGFNFKILVLRVISFLFTTFNFLLQTSSEGESPVLIVPKIYMLPIFPTLK